MSILGTTLTARIVRPARATLVGFALALGSLLALTGCDNNPHPRPLHTQRPDGSPWKVGYSILPDDPRSLDPQFSWDVVGHVILGEIYPGLLQYNVFETDPYKVEPCLAEAMPKRIQNSDGTESYEVHLKHGIFFQDDPCFPGGKGRELKASDFVYTFQRIADPKVECPGLSTLQEFIAGLGTAFQEARKRGAMDYSKPTGAITVIDDYTFRLNMLKAYPQIQYWLALPFTSPVPQEAVAYYDGKNGRDQFKFHPVGTGPFRLAEWSRGRLMRLVRNEHFNATRFPTGGWPAEDESRFRPFAGAAIPFLDETQISIIREAIPGWLLFREGYTDRSGVSKDVFNSVITPSRTLSEKYRERGVQLHRDVEPATFYVQFNMDDPVVGKNRKLRQALSTAFNADRENEIFFNGVNLKAEQLLPPGVVGHDPNFKNPYRTQDLVQAKKLMAEAGYPNGLDPKTGKPLEVTLDVHAEDSMTRQMAEFQQGQIEQLGIRCKVVENNWARFQDKEQRGIFQIITGSGWNADYPDPENFFFLFYSKNFPPAGYNVSRFSNLEFDKLYEQMSTMDNGPERLALIRRMNEIFDEECPVIFESHSVRYSLNQPWVPRVASNAMLSYGGMMKYINLDAPLRDEKQREWNRKPLWPTGMLLSSLACVLGYTVWWARKRNV